MQEQEVLSIFLPAAAGLLIKSGFIVHVWHRRCRINTAVVFLFEVTVH